MNAVNDAFSCWIIDFRKWFLQECQLKALKIEVASWTGGQGYHCDEVSESKDRNEGKEFTKFTQSLNTNVTREVERKLSTTLM